MACDVACDVACDGRVWHVMWHILCTLHVIWHLDIWHVIGCCDVYPCNGALYA